MVIVSLKSLAKSFFVLSPNFYVLVDGSFEFGKKSIFISKLVNSKLITHMRSSLVNACNRIRPNNQSNYFSGYFSPVKHKLSTQQSILLYIYFIYCRLLSLPIPFFQMQIVFAYLFGRTSRKFCPFGGASKCSQSENSFHEIF